MSVYSVTVPEDETGTPLQSAVNSDVAINTITLKANALILASGRLTASSAVPSPRFMGTVR